MVREGPRLRPWLGQRDNAVGIGHHTRTRTCFVAVNNAVDRTGFLGNKHEPTSVLRVTDRKAQHE